MTIVVAITGGIGSGKSTFSNEVLKRGFKLLDSDEQVAKIYKKPSKNFLKHLEKIGLKDVIKNKKINKKKISNIIFTNQKIKNNLEKFIFNLIRINRKKFIKNQKKIKSKIIFLDIPLLFENKLNKDFDIVISIISSKKERLKRLRKSKNMKKSLFNKIIKSQTSNVERIKNSDIVVQNNKSMREYKTKIKNILDKITQ